MHPIFLSAGLLAFVYLVLTFRTVILRGHLRVTIALAHSLGMALVLDRVLHAVGVSRVPEPLPLRM